VPQNRQLRFDNLDLKITAIDVKTKWNTVYWFTEFFPIIPPDLGELTFALSSVRFVRRFSSSDFDLLVSLPRTDPLAKHRFFCRFRLSRAVPSHWSAREWLVLSVRGAGRLVFVPLQFCRARAPGPESIPTRTDL
jgi:hypothetical protein